MLGLLRGIEAWTRAVVVEAHQPGINAAQGRGAFKGTTKTRISARTVEELARMGVRPRAITRQMGIGKTSVYRLLPPATALPSRRLRCARGASMRRRSGFCLSRWGRVRWPPQWGYRGVRCVGCATGDAAHAGGNDGVSGRHWFPVGDHPLSSSSAPCRDSVSSTVATGAF